MDRAGDAEDRLDMLGGQDGLGGRRGPGVLAAVKAYLEMQAKTSSGQARRRIGPGAIRKGDKSRTINLLIEKSGAPDAGRMGACAVGGAGAGRAGAEAVAVGQHAAAENPEGVKPPRGPGLDTR